MTLQEILQLAKQLSPIDKNVAKALVRVERIQIPDLPDRVIAATALYAKVPVISRDRKIKLSNIQTIW